ncbi:hypothetical protein A9Q84_19850 [Halobacteriovorax marinus]|uniref:Radical SAM core domain-containing protein n=1 Tax=Halobacteriovorax marinus TaxID=97084 RepID=A0A1Y5F8I6_9BACT|nr:hypothetical protein A9Q84_19850 [Halobacteriovorax marinus]
MNIREIRSIYIHFPFCRHLCNYCDFYKNIPKNKEKEYEAYEASLVKGFALLTDLLKENDSTLGALNTLYLGGGTPSLWGERGAAFLKNFLLDRNIILGPSCEFTFEVNPGGWTEEGLLAWRDIGVNRYSLGIQSLNPHFLKLIDRVHNIEDVHETLNYFSSKKLSFSVDFMLGLPFSKKFKRDIISELEEILVHDPEHISLYILTTKAGYIHKDHLPDDEYIEGEYLRVSNFLIKRGYDHYEVSNFSKKGKESNHNLQYWKSESVAALGPSATGFLKEAQTRFKWKMTQVDFVLEKLTAEEMKLEEVYMALRINRPFDLSMFTDNLLELEKVLDLWQERKLLNTRAGSTISLNSNGFLILDSLMDDLFKHELV